MSRTSVLRFAGAVAATLFWGAALVPPATAEESNDPALAVALALEARIKEAAAQVTPAYVSLGGGSGVSISSDGYILTNHHVAGGAERWRVTFPSGESYAAKRLGTDPRGDICLLKVEEPPSDGLPFRPLGDSDALAVGEYVLAVGNPYLVGREDNQPTVTLGIVSALHRFQGGYSDCIQTDAAINPGNSGGPLYNLDGEVVGISGRVAVRFGNRINTGVGFAIPANQIRNFLPLLEKGGEVPHGTVGGLTLSQSETDGDGATVRSVSSGSEADKAGFEPGDRIVRVGSQPVTGFYRFHGIVGTYPAGAKLDIVVQRGDEEITLPASLVARRSTSVSRGADTPVLGIQASEEFEGPGVEVESVAPGSGAQAAGMEAGDVIRRICRQEVESLEDLSGHLQRHKAGDAVKVRVQRGTETLELEVTLSRRGAEQK